MDIFAIYIATFFVVFLIMPVVYFLMQFLLWFIFMKCCGREYRTNAWQSSLCSWCSCNRQRQRNASQPAQRARRDRQDIIYTISDETSGNRFNDLFFIEPNSEEAARIRAQLEKDDKDLPSYDDVIRMCNLTTPTAAAAVSMPATTTTTAQAAPVSPVVAPLTIAALPAPPYSETDPNPTPTPFSTGATADRGGGGGLVPPAVPSTSRNAAVITAPETATPATTLQLSHTVANTIV